MKIWSFIKWQWAKFESWQRWYLAIIVLFVTGVIIGNTSVIGISFMYAASVILFYGVIKIFLVNPIRHSWDQFKKEQDSLFEVIKNSDKK